MQTPEILRPVAKKASLLGICQAIGDDFGFNPDFIRGALAFLLLADPKITVIGYALAGIVVLASRLATRPWRIQRLSVRAQTRKLAEA